MQEEENSGGGIQGEEDEGVDNQGEGAENWGAENRGEVIGQQHQQTSVLWPSPDCCS